VLRKRLIRREAGEEGFSWRGEEVSRIESFSDAVFAFAVTLLVVSLEVPKTFDELISTMRGFFAFAICFWLLLAAWFEHYKYLQAVRDQRFLHHAPERRPAVHRAFLRVFPEVPLRAGCGLVARLRH
jgi:hypothetical protein